MPAKARRFSPIIGSNAYVPGMAEASDLMIGQAVQFSLGSPAAQSANNILNANASNAAANTVTNTTAAQQLVTQDSPYGRTVRMTPSGNPGNAYAYDVIGFDYLGQPMIERLTGANGSTGIVYGFKAFYRITSVKLITPSSNAITSNFGTGTFLGLPYKGDVVWAKENGVLVPVYNRSQTLIVDRAAALAIAGGSSFFKAPFPGYVKTLLGWPDGGGGGADPVITVKLATVAITG